MNTTPASGIRFSVAVPMILVGVFTLMLPFLFRPRSAAVPSTVPPAPAANAAGARPAAASLPNISPDASTPAHAPMAASTAPSSPAAEGDSYETTRIGELNNLAMTDDPNALATIESEFDNRNPKIQEAAVAAAVQFGSRDAIPALEAACGHLDDPEQKLRVQQAIDFLKLPTAAEAATGTVPADEADGQN